jgi:nitrogen fixation/metabolism regulation signal transduction histidine kinase
MAKDGTTTPSTSNGGDQERPAALLDEMRRELEHAADDLERVTRQLHQRTDMVDRFEVLVDELLALLPVPVVLIDEDARVTAISRGAAQMLGDPAAAVGKQASSVLPPAVARRVTAYVRSSTARAAAREGQGGPEASDGTEDEDESAGAGSDEGPVVRFLDLPGGSTLVVLEAQVA